jgi:hypothetical protein
MSYYLPKQKYLLVSDVQTFVRRGYIRTMLAIGHTNAGEQQREDEERETHHVGGRLETRRVKDHIPRTNAASYKSTSYWQFSH